MYQDNEPTFSVPLTKDEINAIKCLMFGEDFDKWCSENPEAKLTLTFSNKMVNAVFNFPTSNREAWESLLGISLWVCEEELPPKPKPPLNPYVILGEATLQLLANKDYSEWNTQSVAGKILQHAIWYLQSDIDPQRHFSLMPLLGIF